MNILVIVFKIEILIYNTQMNSTLRQFMSTRIHWISTGIPLDFHWTSTGFHWNESPVDSSELLVENITIRL